MLLFNAIFVQFHKTGTSFQYILCCYSTSTQTGNKRLFTTFISIHFILLFNWQIFNYFISLFVSIHSMLLFNFPSRKPSHKLTGISIHHMLLFNLLSVVPRVSLYTISIHHMLLFNKSENEYLERICRFQYITCCYSTNEKPSFLYLTDLYKSRS